MSMKDRLIVGKVLLVCLLAFASVAFTASPAAANSADYTFLVYMNGSDLESKDEQGSATKDLIEMMAVGSKPNVNVVVETGGTAEWMNEWVRADRNQRWLVKKGGLELLDDSLGARNIGESKTLQDFVEWGIKKYPAKKYALVFWNHGAGSVNGFGADELFDGDSLLLPEIDRALKAAKQNTGVTFELIGFDACLMATIETASMSANYARYMVASEELEPGHGWDYEPILQAIVANPSIDGALLGRAIVDGYRKHAIREQTQDEITLSVVDLSKIAAVEAALNGFIAMAKADLGNPERLRGLSYARSRSEDYGTSGAHGGNTDMVDLVDLVKHAADLYPQASKAVVDAVNAAVVYNINSVSKPRAAGLAIYFPYKDRDNFKGNAAIYSTLPFSAVYRDFVKEYAGLMLEDTEPVGFVNPVPQAAEIRQGVTQYSVVIREENRQDIAEAYSVLARVVDGSETKIMFLGMDDEIAYNEKTGVLSDEFAGEWVTLNGNFVSMFLSNYGDDYTEYAIPAKLNGKELDLMVMYSHRTGESKVIGGWTGVNPVSGQADKNIIKVKQGDTIIPMFYTYDSATDEDGFMEGPAFKVGRELKLGAAPLPKGVYSYGFYVVDFSQNEAYSEFVDFEIGAAAPVPANRPAAIQVKINGELQSYSQPPVVINDRTMVPLRAIFEKLGAEIKWDGDTRTVTATRGATVVVLQVGSANASVNGSLVKLDQAADIVNDSTMVPVRFVSEAMGAEVGWDGDTRTVLIRTK